MVNKPGSIGREEMDSGLFPDCWEYSPDPDIETEVGLKQGFVMNLGEIRFGDWRFRPSAGILYIEHWSGTAWVEQGRFEA